MFNKSTITTIGGAIVAIASAYITIDWVNFDISKEWIKLVLSGIIAIGGYASELKSKKAK